MIRCRFSPRGSHFSVMAFYKFSLNGLLGFSQNVGERCIWLLHWSFAHSCHVFISGVSDITDLIVILTKLEENDLTAAFTAFRISLIGPLGNYNYSSKRGVIVTDWPRQGLHHSWGITCLWLKPVLKDSPGLCCLFVLFAVKKCIMQCNHLGFKEVTVDMMSMIFFLYTLLQSTPFFSDHCREFLQSLVGLSGFISCSTSGTSNIYSAPGRGVCSWLLTRQSIGSGSTGRLLEVKRKQGAQQMTVRWSLAKFKLKKGRRIHDDSHLFQKCSFSSHRSHHLFVHSATSLFFSILGNMLFLIVSRELPSLCLSSESKATTSSQLAEVSLKIGNRWNQLARLFLKLLKSTYQRL